MIEFIINYCAPTLAHIKVANLFSYPLTSLETLKEELRAVNEQINPSGIYATLLKIGKKRALIYVYQQQALEIELRKLNVKQFLTTIGYQSFNLKDCLNFLKKRLMISEAFPHEIGFFLGYPYDDVIGFIEHEKINQYQKCNKSDKKQHPFVFFHVITSLSTKVGIKFLLNQRNC